MDRRSFVKAAGAATVASVLPSISAQAANFAGQTVTVLIPYGVGGGTDLWGRFNAPFLTKYLPGNPINLVKNVPGGGSISGANLFAATAKPDGLTVLVTSGSTQFPYLLGVRQVKYDYRDWKFVMASPTGGVAYISTKHGVKSLADLGKLTGKTLHYASQGATSLDLAPMLAFRLLGLDVQHVFGFPGRGEGRLGFERGEFDIDYQTTTAYLRSSLPLVKNGEAAPLFSFGALDDKGNLVRDPNFPDLPHIAEAVEIVTGKKPQGVEWEAFRSFLIAGFPAQKLLLLPKDTPADIVEAYRNVLRQMIKDADYIARKDDQIGEYEQVTDAAGEELFRQAITITPDARDWVREYLSKTYKVTFD